MCAISGRALGHQHRAAAASRAAITGECAFDGGRVTLFKNQCVVVTELFTGSNLLYRIDIDAAIVVFDRFAIGFARVIDEARFVTAATAINNAAIVEAEEISVIERAFCIGSVLCDFPQNAFALIFNNACAGFYDGTGKNTSAVDGRCFDYV